MGLELTDIIKDIEKKKKDRQSLKRKIQNVAKHLRLSRATKGKESETHMQKAKKLIEKYGFENETE